MVYFLPNKRAGNVVINATQRQADGAIDAIVIPFRVSDTANMERRSTYPYNETEAPGVNVFNLRNEMGWTQRQLGENCEPELDHTTIRRVEHNGGWTRDTMKRIAKALKVKRYTDLFLPPELFAYSRLDEQAKERIATMVQDAADAQNYRKRNIS